MGYTDLCTVNTSRECAPCSGFVQTISYKCELQLQTSVNVSKVIDCPIETLDATEKTKESEDVLAEEMEADSSSVRMEHSSPASLQIDFLMDGFFL